MAKGEILTIEELRSKHSNFYAPTTTTTPVAPIEPVANVPFAAAPDDGGLKAGAKAVGNAPKSAFNLGKNIFSAVVNPIDTVKGAADAVRGLGGKVTNKLSDLTGIEQVGGDVDTATFDAIGASLKERYGSLEAAQKTATEDPVGFGADIVGILAGGAPSSLNKVAQVNRAAKTRIANVAATKLDNAAVSSMEKAIDMRPTDITKIKQPNVAGSSPAEWLLRRDFKGSTDKIISDLGEYRTTTRSAVDEGLSAIDVRVAATDAAPATKTINVLRETFGETIGNEKLVAKLDELKAQNDYSLAELNEIKRMADAELQVFKVNGQIKDNARAKGMANIRDELKTLIEDKAAENGFDNVRDLNKETQVSYAIEDAMQKRVDATSKLPDFGLTDKMVAAASIFSGNALLGAGVLLSKKVLESSVFRTHLAQKLKQLPDADRSALEAALDTRNYTKVAEIMVPIVNEFENSTSSDSVEENPE